MMPSRWFTPFMTRATAPWGRESSRRQRLGGGAAGRRWVMLAVFLLVGVQVGQGQPVPATGAVRIDLQMGGVGSVTEFFRAPNVGQPAGDPTWKHEWRPDGSRPAFPPGREPVVQPPAGTVPPGMTDGAAVWSGIPDGGTAAPTETQVSLPTVLFPVEVDASKAWQPTGVMLRRGQAFEVEVAGRWSMHKDERWCSGEGLVAHGPLGRVANEYPGHLSPICPLPLHPAGTLAGRIGGGPPFPIGLGGVFQADADGELELMPNDVFDPGPRGQPCPVCHDPDGHLWNNQGFLRVGISIP
ncbi:MAG: hypothetical protein OZSIB_3680 [Candidatus Ozemobacter sibiricus]|uniref:Uncharacterized protein n=1 Tax=Candidatus Ozemobacter sibiricus TaxID=2268124 RepID=A0A367ZQ50_9BACT|nr:MAG: hypothetical protein OZSIB_3680 [Candidatus Ozemobacter sibiricus]